MAYSTIIICLLCSISIGFTLCLLVTNSESETYKCCMPDRWGGNLFISSGSSMVPLNEPRREKTGLRGFRPGPTQTGLYKLRKELEA